MNAVNHRKRVSNLTRQGAEDDSLRIDGIPPPGQSESEFIINKRVLYATQISRYVDGEDNNLKQQQEKWLR